MGSANDVEYQLLLCKDLEYLDDAAYEKLDCAVIEVRKMLIALRVKLKGPSS